MLILNIIIYILDFRRYRIFNNVLYFSNRRFMDSCRDCGLELVGDELLSLDNKCAKCTEFKTLWLL